MNITKAKYIKNTPKHKFSGASHYKRKEYSVPIAKTTNYQAILKWVAEVTQ